MPYAPVKMVSNMMSRVRTDTTDGSLSKETIYEILSNQRRRFTIHALKYSDHAMELNEISKRVTAWEQNTEMSAISYDQLRSVYTSIKNTHLPVLEENGLVRYDAETKMVAPTEALDGLDVYTEAVHDREIPWSSYYLGLTGVAGALLLAVEVGVWRFGAVEPLMVTVFIVTAFLVSTIIHYRYKRKTRLGDQPKPPEVQKVQ